MRDTHLTVVIPTYNEAENLPRLVTALFALPLPNLSVLVVDDNSPDGTGKIADELAEQSNGRVCVIHRAGKQGLGSAYITGFKAAIGQGAQAICQMDADFSHPPEKIVEMIDQLSCNDIVLGSRYVPGGNVDERWPVWRKALSRFGIFYARTILGLPQRDVTGGFSIWKVEVLQRFPLERVKSNGYVFQVEMVYIAYLLGFITREVPIYFADRRWGTSKMSFRIQVEAALRTWALKGMYRDLVKA
jgi:dolichol-phosphate mannosyltransferase